PQAAPQPHASQPQAAPQPHAPQPHAPQLQHPAAPAPSLSTRAHPPAVPQHPALPNPSAGQATRAATPPSRREGDSVAPPGFG
ncbi:MAG: hypothetical protein REI11_11820, partial [Patulibacter sp.]|nr:hypothetical protein [Patulibacter sp.]